MITAVVSCEQLPTTPENDATVRAAKASSPRESGFSVLASEFERLHALVYRYLVHRFFDPELAEELTARTFYHAARAVHRLPINEEQLGFWLLRTATNLGNTHLRRARARQFVLRQVARLRLMAMKTETVPVTEDERRRVIIRSAVQSLRAKYQAVIVLRHYSHLSFAEIASVLRCRENAVRVRLSRATEELRQRLGVLGGHRRVEN